METNVVDKEIADKHYRVVGRLEGLESAAKACYCMSGDAVTGALLDTVRMLLQRTLASAWEYAERNTGPASPE